MKTKCICLLFGLIPHIVQAQPPSLSKDVHLEISAPKDSNSLLDWKISNTGSLRVYVYDFYLWGPAYRLEQDSGKVRIETAPVRERPGCAPNRFPPVLLLGIEPGRTIRGDFKDTEINLHPGDMVTLTIAVGTDPYGAEALVKRFYLSNCKHNPYDAIVRWGTIIDSNPIQLPPPLQPDTATKPDPSGSVLLHESGHADQTKPQ
jgi:hypothetical protein